MIAFLIKRLMHALVVMFVIMIMDNNRPNFYQCHQNNTDGYYC